MFVIENIQLGNGRHQAVSNSSVYSQSGGSGWEPQGDIPWDSSCGVPQLAQLVRAASIVGVHSS